MFEVTSADRAEARESLLDTMRRRLAGLAIVQIVIWSSHALFYEPLIFEDLEFARGYRLVELAQCLTLLVVAARARSVRRLEVAALLLFAGILPVHGAALLQVREASFVPFLLTMEWAQPIIALAVLLSFRSALVLFATSWAIGAATVLLRPGFDPDLSDHVVLLLIYGVVAASLRSHEELRAREWASRRAWAKVQSERALKEQREKFQAELHDGVSAALSRASLLLDAFLKNATWRGEGRPAPPENKSRAVLLRARDAVREALAEARALLLARKGSSVPASWLAIELERSLEEVLRGHGVALVFREEDDGSVEALSAEEYHAFCRLVTEAATNALHHASPSELLCRVRIHQGSVEVCVENALASTRSDDTTSSTGSSTGIGLRAAERRFAKLPGGRFSAGGDGRGKWITLAGISHPSTSVPARHAA